VENVCEEGIRRVLFFIFLSCFRLLFFRFSLFIRLSEVGWVEVISVERFVGVTVEIVLFGAIPS